MEFFKRTLNIYLYRVILWLVLIIILLCSMFFFREENPKLSMLLGGLTTGLFVGWLQLLLHATEHKEMEKIKKLGIKEILPYRDDKAFYEKVIVGTKKEIRVLGSTASRFLSDFADEERDDKKALIDALNRNVNVKFLLPDPRHLWKSEDGPKGLESIERIKELKIKYGDQIECRCYAHKPFHNLVLADRNCFVGPIFPNRTSQNTPTIYTDKDSIFAETYLEYFDYEWEEAKP